MNTDIFKKNLGTIILYPNKTHWLGGASSGDACVDLSIAQGASPEEHANNLIRYQLKKRRKDVLIYAINVKRWGRIQLGLNSSLKPLYPDDEFAGFILIDKTKARNYLGVRCLNKRATDDIKDYLCSDLNRLEDWINQCRDAASPPCPFHLSY